MCGNNGCFGGNIWWIIILLLIFGCGNGCGCGIQPKAQLFIAVKVYRPGRVSRGQLVFKRHSHRISGSGMLLLSRTLPKHMSVMPELAETVTSASLLSRFAEKR